MCNGFLSDWYIITSRGEWSNEFVVLCVKIMVNDMESTKRKQERKNTDSDGSAVGYVHGSEAAMILLNVKMIRLQHTHTH